MSGSWFKTESGSTYEYSVESKCIRRVNGPNDPTPRQGKDGEWKSYAAMTRPVVGKSVHIVWSNVIGSMGAEGLSFPGTITSTVVETG